jgi:transcriptional regulator with XRE-family HTH domain
VGVRERLVPFGLALGQIRRRLGATQADVGRRVGRSQSWVSKVERAKILTLTIGDADALCRAMGATLVFGCEAPVFTGKDRQRDAAHAMCVAFVAGRLQRSGWEVEREVQIGHPRRPGWIDLLAFHPITRTLLIIEIKTWFNDMGGLERQLAWYGEHALAAARRRGWMPLHAATAALFLATEVNDQALRANARGIKQRFPVRWRRLAALTSGGPTESIEGWGIAMIDPRSRTATWCRPTVLDGRRSAARYRDSSDFLLRRV